MVIIIYCMRMSYKHKRGVKAQTHEKDVEGTFMDSVIDKGSVFTKSLQNCTNQQ